MLSIFLKLFGNEAENKLSWNVRMGCLLIIYAILMEAELYLLRFMLASLSCCWAVLDLPDKI